MRYAIALEQGGWVVRDAISGEAVTPPATSEEAQQSVAEWNAHCVTRQVEPPVKVDGWRPAGELRFWLLAEGGWWGLVAMGCGGIPPMIFAHLSADGCPLFAVRLTLVEAWSLCAPS